MRENGIEESIDRPLTIALVVDTVGNQGNGTSNSALQWAAELERQGHHVRLVGIGAPEYPARVNRVPLVSWVAAKQLMQFAEPSDTLFRTAFQGVDVVHIYMPFKFGRRAAKVAHQMGIRKFYFGCDFTIGFLLVAVLYWLFKHWLYKHIDHIHVPTEMTASLLRAHGYKAKLHVISNGYSPVYSPKKPADPDASAPVPFRVIASGRLASEKDQITLIKAVSMSRHAGDIQLVIAGTGPLKQYLKFRAGRLLARKADIGFHKHADMPDLLRSGDLFVHCSIADIESVSVIEAMACGLVPVIAASELSAASQFALIDESLFPVRDAALLARRIDWWIAHQAERAEWGEKYAEYTKAHYSVEASVHKFVDMERKAIGE